LLDSLLQETLSGQVREVLRPSHKMVQYLILS